MLNQFILSRTKLLGSVLLTLFSVVQFSCAPENDFSDSAGSRLLFKKLQKSKFVGLNNFVYTGQYQVYENAEKAGKKIEIFILVIPSKSTSPKSPIFHLEGGPGSGATSYAYYYEQFEEYSANRDVVLIDFRGTGLSTPLRCEALTFDKTNPQQAFDDFLPTEKVRDCYNQLSTTADLTQYSTDNAINDIEEIRKWLGYEKINLISFSYGTRAAQAYLRLHPKSIRSVIMYGAAPSFSHRPESFAKDAQQTWDLICEDCRNDSTCNRSYPKLDSTFRATLKALADHPVTIDYQYPHTNSNHKLILRKEVFSELIRSIMYSVEGQRRLPYIVYEAHRGNFNEIIQRAINRAVENDEISDAFYLCVTCSEDVPFIDTLKMAENTANTFLGNYRILQEIKACKNWPKYILPQDYLQPVETSIPTLIISGDHDPVTPPRWGNAMGAKFSKLKHVVIKYNSHSETGMTNIECLNIGFVKFFEEPSNFDFDCLDQMKPGPFFIK